MRSGLHGAASRAARHCKTLRVARYTTTRVRQQPAAKRRAATFCRRRGNSRVCGLAAARSRFCSPICARRAHLVDQLGRHRRLCATTARRGGSDVTQADSKQPCCTRDEGWPLGLGLQDQGSNHRKLRRHNGRGGERCGKGGITRQVCAGKTNASEPLTTCRKRWDVAATRIQLLAWDEARRKPADRPSGDRHEDGVRPARGSCGERGNLAPRCQGRPPSGRSARSRVPMRGAQGRTGS